MIKSKSRMNPYQQTYLFKCQLNKNGRVGGFSPNLGTTELQIVSGNRCDMTTNDKIPY